jgi:hypothetical protein
LFRRTIRTQVPFDGFVPSPHPADDFMDRNRLRCGSVVVGNAARSGACSAPKIAFHFLVSVTVRALFAASDGTAPISKIVFRTAGKNLPK